MCNSIANEYDSGPEQDHDSNFHNMIAGEASHSFDAHSSTTNGSTDGSPYSFPDVFVGTPPITTPEDNLYSCSGSRAAVTPNSRHGEHFTDNISASTPTGRPRSVQDSPQVIAMLQQQQKMLQDVLQNQKLMEEKQKTFEQKMRLFEEEVVEMKSAESTTAKFSKCKVPKDLTVKKTPLATYL